jgi:cold shock CspA family protein
MVSPLRQRTSAIERSTFQLRPDIEELVQGQRVQFDEQISKRSGKPEAIAVELM